MSEKLVTVVMTTYNESSCIRKTISSILDQTYKNIELVIIDDGSTDGTQDILREYSETKNIRVILKEHTGNIGKNLNDCIKLANADVIAVMGADDMWMKNKLDLQMKHLKNDKIVCSNGNVIDKNDNVIYNRLGNFNNDFYLDLGQLLRSNCIFSSSVLAYKYVLKECGLFDETIGNRSEDYALWIRISSRYKIKFINQILMSYRVDGNNLSLRSYSDRRELMLRNLDLIFPYLKHEDKAIVKSATCGIIFTYGKLARFFYLEGNYNNSHYYCKKLLSIYDRKISLKYLKYLTFYLYISFLKYFDR